MRTTYRAAHKNIEGVTISVEQIIEYTKNIRFVQSATVRVGDAQDGAQDDLDDVGHL